MTKKYRLEIPETVDKSLYRELFCLKSFDGKIIEENTISIGMPEPYGNFKINEIPKEWLKEILGPMTSEEAWNYHMNVKSLFDDEIIFDDFEKIWKLCEENKRLKHAKRQSFEEWDKSANVICETNIELMQRYTGRKEGWYACEKNRGYDEDQT